MRTTTVLLFALALGCGSSSSAEPSTSSTESTGSETSGSGTGSGTTAAGPITRATLDEMQAAMFAAYPAPYEQVFADLTGRFGAPMRTDENGLSWWYASDGTTCQGFYVNRANEGHCAGGIMEADAANCATP